MSLPVPVPEITLRDDSRVAIRSTFRRALAFLKTDFWPLLGYATLVCLLAGIVIQFYITALFLLAPLMAGGMLYFVLRIRGEFPPFDAIFQGFKQRFSDLAIINLVTISPLIPLALLSLGYLIFDMLPTGHDADDPSLRAVLISGGVWTAVIFGNLLALSVLMQFTYLASMLCLDHDLSARQSLKLTWAATKRHGGKILLFAVLWFTLSIVGMFVLYVGSFVVWAAYSLANAYLYEDLFRKRHVLPA